MTTENNTTQAPAATLTEKELWALFVSHTMQSTFSMGPTVERYRPDDLVRDPGSWGGTQDYSAQVADAIEDADSPGDELDCRIEETETYLDNLKRAREDFERLKQSLLIEDDNEDSRFRAPIIGGVQEAA